MLVVHDMNKFFSDIYFVEAQLGHKINLVIIIKDVSEAILSFGFAACSGAAVLSFDFAVSPITLYSSVMITIMSGYD